MCFRNISFLLTVFALLLFSCREEPKKEMAIKPVKQDSVVTIPPLVRPPHPEINTAFESFEIDAEKGGEFVAEKSLGSKIIIPENIFVDSSGNPVKGKINLTYRELHDAVSIYFAGIPMDYDAAGMLKRFETAGMFELRAQQDDKNVFVDSGKVITVIFGGYVKGSDYHCFYLDEKGTRNWHYVGDESGAGNKEKERILRANNSLPLKIPLGPQYFTFNYMAALDVYLGNNVTQIEQNRNNPSMKTKIKDYGLNWSNIYNYQNIIFEGNKYLASMLVWKNISGTPFPEWVGTAESFLTLKYGNVYEIKIEDKKGNKHISTIEAIMPVKSLFAFSAEEWKKNYNATLRKIQLDAERLKTMADVYRTMEINKFGIYNYDRLMNDENHLVVKVDFKFDTAIDIIQNTEVCFVGSENRSLIKFPYEKWNHFVLAPDQKGKLFAILPGNNIAYYGEKDLKKIDLNKLRKSDDPQLTIEMKTVRQLKTMDDLREVLK